MLKIKKNIILRDWEQEDGEGVCNPYSGTSFKLYLNKGFEFKHIESSVYPIYEKDFDVIICKKINKERFIELIKENENYQGYSIYCDLENDGRFFIELFEDKICHKFKLTKGFFCKFNNLSGIKNFGIDLNYNYTNMKKDLDNNEDNKEYNGMWADSGYW